jgi:hypothetical protein
MRGIAAILGSLLLAAKATPSHGINLGALITEIGVPLAVLASIATIVSIFPMTRAAAVQVWRALLLRSGASNRRYAARFAEEYGTYKNPYLNEEEPLDLRNTFVPLSFEVRGARQVQAASTVLAGLPERLIITGSPGSGKSTLLQAEAVSALVRHGITADGSRVVPYLIQLRDFATFLGTGQPRKPGESLIVSYLIHEILVKRKFCKDAARATEFFQDTLNAGFAVLMLDGLDEVPDDRLDALLDAIGAFMQDGSAAHPTEKARIWLTCRAQNFEMLRVGWIDSAFAPYDLYTLAEFRDSDIQLYLEKFGYQQKFSYMKKPPRMFATAEGPQRFLDTIRADNKIDLLRVPLILAMAVGLYAERPENIPSTIGELYRQMVEEMLNRHSFGEKPGRGRSLNRYETRYKYTLLRRFALHAATETESLGDFNKASLLEFAAELADSLEMGGNPDAFVEEIILHSGLLTSAGRDDLLHYAHRSIQEFLAAQQLRPVTDDAFLLAVADKLSWRQVIQFYTAGREAQDVDGFLDRLAKRNPELAVRCLQAADPSVTTALSVIGSLQLDTRESVTALAAATRSPRPPIRAMAIERLKEAILSSDGPVSRARLGTEDLLPLLESLAGTNSAEIVTILPPLMSRITDDPRLVRPLWQCLGADGIEDYPAECAQIVQRLLELATRHRMFDELARLDRRDRGFLAAARKAAYPFENGLEPGHNLISLLAWAEFLGLQPKGLNRFFDAKAAGKLRTVEADKRKTIVISLCHVGRVVTSLMGAAAFVTTILVLAARPGLLLHPFGWWTLALIVGIALFTVTTVVVADTSAMNGDHSSEWWRLNPGDDTIGHAYIVAMKSDTFIGEILDSTPGTYGILAFCSATFAIAPIPLAVVSLSGYIALSICAHLLFWLPGMNLFNSDRSHYYLYRPNKFVDIYEDSKSRHWVTRPKRP